MKTTEWWKTNKQTLHLWLGERRPKYWSFSFNISPSNEYSGLISFRIYWFYLLAVPGILKSLLEHHNSKASTLHCWQCWLLPGGPEKKAVLTHSGYRLNSVPVILVQRSLFPFWLSDKNCSQSLRLLEVPSHRSPSQQWKNIIVLTPSQASNLFDFLFYLLEKTNFKGLYVCINTCKCSPFCHIM